MVRHWNIFHRRKRKPFFVWAAPPHAEQIIVNNHYIVSLNMKHRHWKLLGALLSASFNNSSKFNLSEFAVFVHFVVVFKAIFYEPQFPHHLQPRKQRRQFWAFLCFLILFLSFHQHTLEKKASWWFIIVTVGIQISIFHMKVLWDSWYPPNTDFLFICTLRFHCGKEQNNFTSHAPLFRCRCKFNEIESKSRGTLILLHLCSV